MDNQDKNVLLISPDFFNYSQIIKSELEKIGYCVDWFSDRNSVTFFKRALLRVKKQMLANEIKKYLNKILNFCEHKSYAYVLVINGEVITEEFLKRLRDKQKQAKFVLYMWDSLENFKDSQKLLPYFDFAYSFDQIDAQKYSLKFLPLFYYEENAFERFTSTPNEYDYAYIGTVKRGKLKALNTLFGLLGEHYSNGFAYLFLQKRLVYLYYKLKDADFKKSKMGDFRYRRLSTDQCNDVLMKSNIVVDVPMKNQNGLTIRTMETISRGQRLITTNAHIENYDFYREDQIYIYRGGRIDFTHPFFQNDQAIRNEQIKKYYIGDWLKQLLATD